MVKINFTSAYARQFPRPMGNKPAIVFDIGRVLIDWDWKITLKNLSPWYSKEIPQDINPFVTENLAHIETGALASEVYYEEMIQKLSLTCSILEFQDAWSSMLHKEVEGMPELLSELSEIFLLVGFSNTCRDHMRYCFENHTILQCLDSLARSDEIGCRKPEPKAYKLVEQKFLNNEKPVLFVDDMPENIEAGQKLGWVGHPFQSAKILRKTLKKMNIL